MDKRIDEIIDYWFAEAIQEGQGAERSKFWFGKSEQADLEVKQLFLTDVEKLVRGEYSHWLEQPRGRLASILLIDQFCRQIYRDTAKAFEYDPMALDHCLKGIELGHDLALSRPLRFFYYLPLEHSENMIHQNQCVAAYQAMVEEAPPEHKHTYIDALDYAQSHLDIIARFNRFPHRNEILGRVCTEEEIEFLKQPGSSF